MFNVNEYVVYKGSGVCRIIDIGTLDFGGMDKEKKFYFLRPVHAKESITYAPVDNAKVPMRKVLSKEEAQELIDTLPEIEVMNELNDKQAEQKYREIFKNCNCREYLSIIKTIFAKNKIRMAAGKKITSTDERYCHMAEELLYNELSLSLGLDRLFVEGCISDRLQAIC